jgi:hypothetical protein
MQPAKPIMLDLSQISQHYKVGSGDRQIDVASLIRKCLPALYRLEDVELIRAFRERGFGFAMSVIKSQRAPAIPCELFVDEAAEPTRLLSVVFYDGKEGPRFAANAAGKVLLCANTGYDSLYVSQSFPALIGESNEPQGISGIYPWLPYPWGGGVFVQEHDLVVICAVSTLRQGEDGGVASLLGHLILDRVAG